MRNLKRALSLALASVMLLGMMVVGTSAKGLDFGDAAEINNADAVAVTSAIGIFKGYDDGEFKPENVVTRAEMAVIIAKMLYGADVKVEQFAEISTFTDVPAWAEGYVNLCASLGIVAGRGNGIFDPDATVTTAEAAMMLTKALGYFQNAKDFGDDWTLAATAKATQLGLYGDLKLSAKAGLTRENVAVMVFNALTKTVPVQYNELLGVYYNENKGIVYSLTFYYTDTLGYKNFDLVYRSDEYTAYGRPGTTWGTGSYRGTSATTAGNDNYGLNEDGSLKPGMVKMLAADEIITIAETPDYVYTAGTKQKTVYNDLGKAVTDKNSDYEWTYFVDGKEYEGAKPENKSGNWGMTKTGAETEVYIDSVNETVTVVKINNYLAEVSKVKEDYALIKVLSDVECSASFDNYKFETEDFEEDDLVVITVDCADHFDDDDDAFIATVAEPETAEGVVTLVDKDYAVDDDSYLKMDSVKYTYSKNTVGDLEEGEKHPALKDEYRLFLDPNGYVLGFEPVDESVKEYLYVEKAHIALNVQANVVFSDGTTATIDIKDEYKNKDEDGDNIAIASEDELEGHAFAYTVNDKDIYTLEMICEDDMGEDASAWHSEGDIDNGEAYIYGETNRYLVDLDTVFVDVADEKAYVGYDEVPNYENADFIVVGENRVKDIVFIISGEMYGDDSTYVFIADHENFDSIKYDGDYYYVYFDAYVDGEKVDEFYVERDLAREEITTEGLYKVKRVIDEVYVIAFDELPEFPAGVVTALGNGSFWLTDDLENGIPEEGAITEKFTYDAETIFVTVEFDGEDVDSVSVGSKKDIVVMDEDYIAELVAGDETIISDVIVVKQDDQYAELVYIAVMDLADFVEDEEEEETAEIEVVIEDTTITVTGAETYSAAAKAVKAELADADYTNVVITVEGETVTAQADLDGITYTFEVEVTLAAAEA